jgi:hypothetical protein
VFSVVTPAFRCTTCAGAPLRRYPSRVCGGAGHTQAKCTAVLRWFRCRDCRTRHETLDRKVRTEPCVKCGGGVFEPAAQLARDRFKDDTPGARLVHREAEIWSLRNDMSGGGQAK